MQAAVRVWRKDGGHGEVEEEEVRPVDPVEVLHHVALQLPHEVRHQVGRAAPLGGVPQHVQLPAEVSGEPSDVQHLAHLSQCVHVDYESEVTETRSTVVRVETPVRILNIRLREALAGTGLRRTTCPQRGEI